MTEPTESLPHDGQASTDEVAKLRMSIMSDALVIVVLAVVTFFTSSYFGAFELLVTWVEVYEAWELDEFLIVGNVLLIVAAFFFSRRLREMKRIVRERDKVLGALYQSQQVVHEKRKDLERLALTDQVTGLANRACLMTYLKELLAKQNSGVAAPITVMFFDLDCFKRINDLHGHAIGDELLREVANRIQQVLGMDAGLPNLNSKRLVSRIGGDEFVAVLDDVSSLEDAREITEDLVQSLSKSHELHGVSVTATASIGVVVNTSPNTNAEILISSADAALYEAKNNGREKAVFYDNAMREQLQRRVGLDVDLRSVLDRDELHLVYQPIVCLISGRVEGVEALLRWTHPELGAISPAEFVPIAEDSDLILDLGEWVLRESLRQMATWIEESPTGGPELMSVNVSRRQLANPGFVRKAVSIIRHSGVPAERIQIEITEDMHGESDVILATLRDLKHLGVRIAIDDFGTGSSTFSAVEQFSIDTLKIDRSLVAQLVESKDAAAIVHALSILVRNLDIKLIAEGVETPQQVLILQDLGCYTAQGFLFSEPLRAGKIESMFTLSTVNNLTITGLQLFPELWSSKLPVFRQFVF